MAWLSGPRLPPRRGADKTNHPLRAGRARSSAGEHYVDIVGVAGSIPAAPTMLGLSPIRGGRDSNKYFPLVGGAKELHALSSLHLRLDIHQRVAPGMSMNVVDRM
jgi:hypothetical protein